MSLGAFWRALVLLLCTELSAVDFPSLPSWSIKHLVDVSESMDCGVKSEWAYKATDSEVLVRPRKEILARGRDRSGLAWRVQAEYPGDGGCRFFVHDLDRNGAQDLVFLTANGGSGPAGVTMTVLAFDRDRRPVPWQATSSFSVKDDRLLNFVDLNGDKRAELLFQHFEAIGTNGELGISTALYTITDGYFRRVIGTFGGKTFPIRPPRLLFAEEPDLTNALPVGHESQQIARVQPRGKGPCWLQDIRVSDKGIELAPNSTASKECEGYLQSNKGHQVPLPVITVLDMPKHGRVIDINHSSEVINQAAKAKSSAVLTGRSCETGCRPFILWAHSQ